MNKRVKYFAFQYKEYTAHASVTLYSDGGIQDIEVENIWHKDADLLAIYCARTGLPLFVHKWMAETMIELKRKAATIIQRLLLDATSIYMEYNFL